MPAARLHQAARRGAHHRHRAARAEGAGRGESSTASHAERSCCSPARAASARPPSRPRPRCAAPSRGLRTLVLSTDPAHSLADAFDMPPRRRCRRRVADSLGGQQLDATERLEETWADIQRYVMRGPRLGRRRRHRGRGARRSSPASTRSSRWPTSRRSPASGDYDVIVVDCAPTAETIRFLSLPDILSWYMDRIFPVERRVAKVVRPVLQRVTTLPVAGDDVFAAVRRFYDRLDGVRELLTDGETHQRAPRRQPRAHGDRRGAPHRHLPLAVRLPRRRGRSRTGCCPTRSPTRGSTRGRRRTPSTSPHRGRLRAAAGAQGRAGARGAGRPRAPARLRRRALRRRRRRTRCSTAASRCASTREGDDARAVAATCRSPTSDDLEVGRARRRAARAGRSAPAGASCCPTRFASATVGRAKMVDDRLEISSSHRRRADDDVTDANETAKEALEHLQKAALEMIAARCAPCSTSPRSW